MKILQVNQYCGRKGGTEQYIGLITEELARMGHRVSLLCDDTDNANDAGRSAVYRVPGITPYLLEREDDVTEKVVGVIEQECPDVINIHNVHNSLVVQALLSARPTVRYVHDHTLVCPRRRHFNSGAFCTQPFGRGCLVYNYIPPLCWGAFSRRPWMTGRYYASFRATIEANRKLKRLAVASDYMRRSLLENGFREDIVELLPYFTDISERRVPPGDSILFVGRLIPEKGVHLLLDAMARGNADWSLVVVGDGPAEYGRALASRTARLGIGRRVEFAGGQPHERLSDFYESARAVVLPSVWPEPFGIVGIEAMAHGRAVAAFDVGGIRDWLVDTETGFLVPPGDTRALAEGMGKLMESRDLAAEMGEKGRALVEEKFTRAAHMDGLLRLYREACA